jgi:4-diphosphocytidyl-2-C-methyl-D-erythritol kinase
MLALFLSSQAPAKLNLGLHVLRKRPDGYHDLETVFVRIGWCDQISVKEAETLSLTSDDAMLTAEDENLCLRAGRILQSEFGVSGGAEIDLKKNIPIGAGLGGGSSDAATTLSLLNKLWRLGCSNSVLRALGARLGSDVPVFIHETPAFGTGRGEILSTLTLEIPYSFAVLKPDVHISTAEAYNSIVPDDRKRPDLVAVIQSLDLDRWKAELVNDFEASIAGRHSGIAEALTLLRASGAGYAAMSGSGSAVFGVFERASDAADAAREGAHEGLTTWNGRIYQPIRPF